MIPKVLFTFRTSEFLGFDFSSHGDLNSGSLDASSEPLFIESLFQRAKIILVFSHCSWLETYVIDPVVWMIKLREPV